MDGGRILSKGEQVPSASPQAHGGAGSPIISIYPENVQANDDHEFTRERGIKRKTLAELRDTDVVKRARSSSDTGSGSKGPTADGKARRSQPGENHYDGVRERGLKRKKSAKLTDPQTVGKVKKSVESTPRSEDHVTNGQVEEEKHTGGGHKGDISHVTIDTQSSPADLPGVPYRPTKTSSPSPEPVEVKPLKKRKKQHSGTLPESPGNKEIELEDISAEVDARMKEKAEKRKKRKRHSDESSALVDEKPDTATTTEKHQRKKTKMDGADAPGAGVVSKKRQGDDGEAENVAWKASKKRKKTKGNAN